MPKVETTPVQTALIDHERDAINQLLNQISARWEGCIKLISEESGQVIPPDATLEHTGSAYAFSWAEKAPAEEKIAAVALDILEQSGLAERCIVADA